MSEIKETKLATKKVKKDNKITKELLYGLTEQTKEKVEGIPLDGIFVKVLSGFERRSFHQKMADDKKLDSNGVPATMVPSLIALCAIDECGENIFGTEDADIEEIDKKVSSLVQSKIFGVAAKLNGLTSDSVEESKKN